MVEIVDEEGEGQVGANDSIVEAADQIVKLHKLRFLKLDCLPKLINFYHGLIDEEEQNPSSRRIPLFSDKVVLPNLAELGLLWIHQITKIWSTSATPDCISNLTKLDISDCGSLEHLFSFSMAKGLVKLRHLKVDKCKNIREIIATESANDAKDLISFPQLNVLIINELSNLVGFYSGNCIIAFPSLNQIAIKNCPKLKGFIVKSTNTDVIADVHPFFNEQVKFPAIMESAELPLTVIQQILQTQLPTMTVPLQNLTKLGVYGCTGDIKYLFTSSVIKSFVQLKELVIVDCKIMKGVIEAEEENNCEELFPKLELLELTNLPELATFYMDFTSKMHITKWSSLREIKVASCNKVRVFASEFTIFKRINGDNQLKGQLEHPLFWVNQDTFQSLETLKLIENESMKDMWYGQYPRVYFPKLKHVYLSDFHVQTVVPSSFFFRSLPHLQTIDVTNSFFDEIFGSDGDEKHADSPTWLNEPELSGLYGITQFRKEEPDLKNLKLKRCSKLKNLLPSFLSFKNLCSLEVSNCDGLKYLMRVSTAKSLVGLQRMTISGCAIIQEIIACLDDDVKDGIVFPRLRTLELHGLPRLSSFCSVECKFLSLKYISVHYCPNLQSFSPELED